jgi:hypothetical protein
LIFLFLFISPAPVGSCPGRRRVDAAGALPNLARRGDNPAIDTALDLDDTGSEEEYAAEDAFITGNPGDGSTSGNVSDGRQEEEGRRLSKDPRSAWPGRSVLTHIRAVKILHLLGQVTIASCEKASAKVSFGRSVKNPALCKFRRIVVKPNPNRPDFFVDRVIFTPPCVLSGFPVSEPVDHYPPPEFPVS